jgi:hypothetical protein
MMGRSMSGKQFWAVPASDGSRPLVVFDLSATDDFQRIVVAVDNPTEVAAALQRGRRPLVPVVGRIPDHGAWASMQ